MNINIIKNINTFESHLIKLKSLTSLLKTVAFSDSDIEQGDIMSLTEILDDEALKTVDAWEELTFDII